MAEVTPTGQWVPTACSLPTPEQPLRIAEFDAVFRSSVRDVNRCEVTRLELVLDGAVEGTVRELAAKESQCCSFFRFDFSTDSDDRLTMSIGVPHRQIGVLDALESRVRRFFAQPTS